MKAALIKSAGGPEVLEYGDLPDPVAGPGEIVVDIHAASVNGADWKVREGSGPGAPKEFPYVLGRDFSGVVAALGDGVTEFKVGDEVYGVCDQGQEGAYAEKIAIKASICAPKPKTVSHVEAAALALAGLTALISVEDTIKLKSGETILIQGGAGGVASFAIQLAKHLGAHVITTTSEANIGYVKSLGADEVIDYNAQNVAEVVSGCDAAFDTVGGPVTQSSFAVLKPGGRAAFIASGGTAPPSENRDDVESLRPAVKRDHTYMERVAVLIDSGAVKAPEITTYPLSAASAAHMVSQGRHLRGKLVFTVR